jgi:hypothetical protein
LSGATLPVEGGGIRVEPYGANRLKDGIGARQPAKASIASNRGLNRFIDRLLFGKTRSQPFPLSARPLHEREAKISR